MHRHHSIIHHAILFILVYYSMAYSSREKCKKGRMLFAPLWMGGHKTQPYMYTSTIRQIAFNLNSCATACSGCRYCLTVMRIGYIAGSKDARHIRARRARFGDDIARFVRLDPLLEDV